MNNTLIQIKIDNFEGPLDLLLHLIDKKQMKITEINISQIIDDYLKYIKEQKELNLKIAYSRRNISFRKITDEEQQHFKLKDINMVVVIETHAYLSNGMLFQYETIVHHPEKFTFTAIAKR